MDAKILLRASSMVLIRLNSKELTTTEIAKSLDVTFCHTAKVLKELLLYNYVSKIKLKCGRKRFYKLTKKGKLISDNLLNVYEGIR